MNSETNNKLYWKYYNALHKHKDYAGEVDTILKLYNDQFNRNPLTVLDVGCGTGIHALYMGQKGICVTGIDKDEDAIEIAKQAFIPEGCRPKFTTGNILCHDELNIDGGSYSLVVSLFNVVNYIHDIHDLIDFFDNIYAVTKDMFIFDVWNGVAALFDPPKTVERKIECKEGVIHARVVPSLYRYYQKCHMGVTAVIPSGEYLSYNIGHTLWTPAILKKMLSYAGFEEVYISSWENPTVPADLTTWKVLFTCKK